MIINIYAPPGAGKTKYKQELAGFFECDFILDGGDVAAARLRQFGGRRVLVLSQLPIPSLRGLTIKRFAMAEILSRIKGWKPA